MAKVSREFLSSLVGETIVFNKKIKDWESYAEPTMRGIVKKFQFDDDNHEPVHKVWVDFYPFEKENHRLQNANFYDKNGNAVLTAVEAGFYRSLDDISIDSDMDQLPFEVFEDIIKIGTEMNYRDSVFKVLENFPDRADFANSDNYADAVDKWYSEITA